MKYKCKIHSSFVTNTMSIEYKIVNYIKLN